MIYGKVLLVPKNTKHLYQIGTPNEGVEMDEWAEDMWTAIADQDRKIEEAKK